MNSDDKRRNLSIYEEADTNSEQYEKEKYVVEKLSAEYVSLYRIELNSGKYEILRLQK